MHYYIVWLSVITFTGIPCNWIRCVRTFWLYVFCFGAQRFEALISVLMGFEAFRVLMTSTFFAVSVITTHDEAGSKDQEISAETALSHM